MSELIRKSVENMSGYIPGEQPDDAGIVKLNTNENPYPPSPLVQDALSSLNPEDLRLYPNPVSDKLRSLIADIHSCDPKNVFVGNGSDEVLALCTRAFVENDGSIGYLEPSYSLYPVLSDIRDVAKKPVALKSDLTWDIPADYTASLFMLTNPNAPTGMLASVEQVGGFCDRFDGVVLVDEAYADFSRWNCMELALTKDNVLVARTLSKSFSLAGLRVGYAVGSESLISAMYKLKDSYNLNMISQTAAEAALSDLDHMRANVAKIVCTRERLVSELLSRGYRVSPSDSNFVWVKPCAVTAKDLFESLRNKGILVRYFEGSITGEYIRITIGTDDEIDKLIEAIK
jgi:histidinol-phosphate aminotransferase